ncbi:MAG: hypothetical protein MJ107_04010 [Lachnospiraceae bacterium]|nr:hypothetical protein [Lachnospiraceae bacterium]
MTYVEKYAQSKGITVEEAMTHALIKEYIESHPEETPDVITESKLVCGCGGGSEVSE